MTYEIDQSIKIENTNKASYVSLANSHIYTVSILAREKQILKRYFRRLGKPLIFKIFCFACLCAECLSKQKVDSVYIDKEYLGYEREIKSFIVQVMKIKNKPETDITFKQVGKKSPSHVAVNIARKKRLANSKISSQQILKLYEKINKK